MKKILLSICLILFSATVFSQSLRGTLNRSGTTLEISASYQEFSNLIRLRILSEAEFERYAILLGRSMYPELVSIIYLPPDSERVDVIFSRKTYDREQALKIVDFVRNSMYEVVYVTRTRVGYQDVYMEMRSSGAYYYRRESNISRGPQIFILPNGMVSIKNGYNPDYFPYGSRPRHSEYFIRRISQGREAVFWVEKKKKEEATDREQSDRTQGNRDISS